GTYPIINWTGDIGSNSPTALNLTGLCSGEFVLQVFDSNDCSETFSYIVNEPEVLELVIDGIEDIDCAGFATGGIAFHAEGGTPGYTYWIEDENGVITNGNIFTNLGPGSYTLYVQDDNDCSVSQVVEIDEPSPLQAQISAVIQIPEQLYVLQCAGDCDAILEADVTGGTGSYTYTWTDGDGIVIGTGVSIENLCAGTYCLAVTDANGCAVSTCFDVTEPEAPLITTSTLSDFGFGNEISCNSACDGSIDLTVTGGVADYSYQWNCSDCGGLSGVEDQNNLCAGFYEVLVTDANFCDQLLQFTLDEPPALTVTTTLSTYGCGYNVSCDDACDGSISLQISGGVPEYVIDWTEAFLPDETEVNDLCPGTYTVCVTDAMNCQACLPVTIIAPEPLTASIDTDIDCESGLVSLCGNISGGCAPYNYQWSDGDTGNCITIVEDGTYCVDVIDSNGCTANVCIEDVVDPDPLTGELLVTTTTCGACNGSIELVLEGGLAPFDIQWTGTGTLDGELLQTDLCPGSYSVSVTDANGCPLDATVTVPNEDGIEVNEQVTNVLCFGGSTGSIFVEIDNAAEPVTITWEDAQGNDIGTGPSVSGLPAGSYTMSWQDAEGCFGTETYTISQPGSPLVLDAEVSLYDNDFNISTIGGNDGYIIVDVSGGTGPYVYTWAPATGNDTTTVNLNLEAGEYALTVTDANGCTIDSLFVLEEPLDLEFPTGFSPNGDGNNQFFVILGVESFPDNEFKVFNRWGNVVYEKSGYNNEWEGQNSNGDPLADGTYYVVFTAGDREYNGYVDLRR
ncbi:MAG: gliding motility-associated C-terminal domain-containing protein, partial [Flavobacteriales bacterium]|nr:gliding motility-associated C-terminal domain-containing protein [Flavobacteriales bacterium]